MNKLKTLALLMLLLLVVDVAFGQGCSQCKLVAEQGSELDEASFGSNINYGILYLMAMPYILLLLIFRKRILNTFKKLSKSN